MLRTCCTAKLRPTASTFTPLLALLCSALIAGCSDDSSSGERTSTEPDSSAPLSRESTALNASDYCARICNAADDCDEDFDEQICRHRCDNQSGSIAKLNPKLQSDLYECFEDSQCAAVNSDNFVAGCLNDAVTELEVSKAGNAFCKELEEAVEACEFDADYDQGVCLQTTLAFADDVLADAKFCAGKACEFVVECLEAAFTLPGELDGTDVGVDAKGEVASGTGAGNAVAALLPEVVVSPVSPDVSPDEDQDASIAPAEPDVADDGASDTSHQSADASDEPIGTTDEPKSSNGPEDNTGIQTGDTTTTNQRTIDASSELEGTDTTETVLTDTSSVSQPEPTSEGSTDFTDVTETADSVNTTDTIDTTDTNTTDSGEEACRQCTDNACSDAVLACYNNAGCNAIWAAYEACWDAYPYSDQTEARLVCLQPTWDATEYAAQQLFLSMLDCYDTVPANDCAQYCQ